MQARPFAFRSMQPLHAIAVLAVASVATTVAAQERGTFADPSGFDPVKAVIFEDSKPSPLNKAISPDGKLRAETEYQKLRVYSVEENELLHEFTTSAKTHAPQFSADGATLYAAVGEGNLESNSTLYSWDLKTGEQKTWGQCSGTVLDISTDANGQRLAVTTSYGGLPTFVLADRLGKWSGGEIVVFDADHTDALARIYCELSQVPSLAELKPETEDKKEFKKFMNDLGERLADANRRCLAVRVGLTPDGEMVIGMTTTGVVKVFDVAKGKTVLTLSSQSRIPNPFSSGSVFPSFEGVDFP